MIVFDRWLVLAQRLARYGVWFAGALLLAAAVLVSVAVLARTLLSRTLGGADELSGYAFAIGTAWALAFTLLERANVRVDALYIHLPKPVCAGLDVLAQLSLGVFVALLSWQAWVVLEPSLAFDARATTPLQTPLWIPQALWLAGMLLFLFTWVPLLLRASLALAGGDLDGARRLIGARSIEEDAAAESAHAAVVAPPSR